jgi:hypothetical protein
MGLSKPVLGREEQVGATGPYTQTYVFEGDVQIAYASFELLRAW